jgi:hypothetical protein
MSWDIGPVFRGFRAYDWYYLFLDLFGDREEAEESHCVELEHVS